MEKAENIALSEPCLVLLIGPSGSGKSTFARRHFQAVEILSSDFCRALVANDEADQTASADAFELLRLILDKRLRRRLTTVVDATNVTASARNSIISAARQRDVPTIAIVFNLPEEICMQRNLQRTGRQVPPAVIQKQLADLHNSLSHLPGEGFRLIVEFQTAQQVDLATIKRYS